MLLVNTVCRLVIYKDQKQPKHLFNNPTCNLHHVISVLRVVANARRRLQWGPENQPLENRMFLKSCFRMVDPLA